MILRRLYILPLLLLLTAAPLSAQEVLRDMEEDFREYN